MKVSLDHQTPSHVSLPEQGDAFLKAKQFGSMCTCSLPIPVDNFPLHCDGKVLTW